MSRPVRPIHAAPFVAALSATVLLTLAPAASAKAPGDNGDVKVHKTTTAITNERDNPKVCRFYLDAFHFDTVQSVSWSIAQQPPTGHKTVLTGSITLANGTGHTVDMGLPNGHYKLTWKFQGEHGRAKHKVFKVSCPPVLSVPPGTTTVGGHHHTPGTPGGPHGGTTGPVGAVSAGVGGASEGVSVGEIAAGSVLLTAAAAGGGAVLLRRRRRRSGRATS